MESSFRFLGYRVSQIILDIDDNFGAQPEKITQHIQVENHFVDGQELNVEVVLNVKITTESGKLALSLKIKGAFQADNQMPADQFRNLAKINAPAILYPYARSLITNFTAQANISPIILPILNFSAHEPIENRQ